MNTLNTNWNSIIGKRALFSRLSHPPHEDRVMEMSPSGDHVRFEKNGWESAASYVLVELLETVVPEATPKQPQHGMGRMGDFTPEELADLPFSLDLGFTREELDEARRLAVA
jgi:hypothetical protein